MVASKNEILKQAMALPVADRAALVEALAQSLGPEPLTDEDRAWLEVCVERRDAYLRGEVQAIPADEVLRRAQRP